MKENDPVGWRCAFADYKSEELSRPEYGFANAVHFLKQVDSRIQITDKIDWIE